MVGDAVYVAALAKATDHSGPEMRLLQLPANGSGPAKVLSRTPAPGPAVRGIRANPNAFFQSPRFLSSSHYEVCSDDGDVFVQPLSGGTGRLISATKELPGQYVMAATDLGDSVFLALSAADGGSYLVSYDLKTGQTQTLVSSRRVGQQSPFDNAPPMAVPFMASDPARDRIIFFAYHSEWVNAAKGLWEYNHRTGKFKKLRDTAYARKEGQGGYEVFGSSVVDNTFILKTGVEDLVYDMATDAPTKTIPDGLKRFHSQYESPTVFHDWWHRYGNPGGSGVGFGDNTIERRLGDVHAFSELWQGAYPSFAEDESGGTLLVGDETGLWLLTPR